MLLENRVSELKQLVIDILVQPIQTMKNCWTSWHTSLRFGDPGPRAELFRQCTACLRPWLIILYFSFFHLSIYLCSNMTEKLAQPGEGWVLRARPLSLYVPSRTKLWCTLQLRGQIRSPWPYFYSTPMYSVVSSIGYVISWITQQIFFIQTILCYCLRELD